MEQLVRSGLVRSIGIANFNKKQILRVLECCDIPPAVLQVESHPYFLNEKIITFARGSGMQVTAHAVLGSAYRDVCVTAAHFQAYLSNLICYQNTHSRTNVSI